MTRDVAVASKVCAAWAAAPMYGVTTYPVSGVPPVLVGAVQVTVALKSPAAADGLVGAPGALPLGVMAFELDDAGPVPMALIAATVNVYAVPLVRPVTVWVRA